MEFVYRGFAAHGSLVMTICETDIDREDWAIGSFLEVKRLISSVGTRCANSTLYMVIAMFFLGLLGWTEFNL